MKPMLAATLKDKPPLRFPCYASVKIDGIRAVVKDAILLSRTLIPIPNFYTQDLFGSSGLEGLDGELTVGPSYAPNVMQATMSGVMSQDGEPDELMYWVFDYWTDEYAPFSDRILRLQAAEDGNYLGAASIHPRVRLLQQTLIRNEVELLAYEKAALERGFEGIMTRCPEGRYKFGRSTPKEQFLVKHKRWKDAEAKIIGFEERMHNANEATTDERGYTKRSSHKDNLIGTGTLGSFLVVDKDGREFGVGTGLTDAQRREYWIYRQSLLGGYLTYKSFEQTGVKDAARFAVFKSLRDYRDIV